MNYTIGQPKNFARIFWYTLHVSRAGSHLRKLLLKGLAYAIARIPSRNQRDDVRHAVTEGWIKRIGCLDHLNACQRSIVLGWRRSIAHHLARQIATPYTSTTLRIDRRISVALATHTWKNRRIVEAAVGRLRSAGVWVAASIRRRGGGG
jgi:hypothetical protein